MTEITAPIAELQASQVRSSKAARVLVRTFQGERSTGLAEHVTGMTPARIGGGEKVHYTGLSFVRATEDFDRDGISFKAGDTAQFQVTYVECGATSQYSGGGYGTVRTAPGSEITCSKCLKKLAK